MVVDRSNVDHIMRGLQSTEGVRLHNHRKKLRQRFDIIKKLGQGTYGKVQLGINKETGQEVAIKTIKKCKIETEADLVRIRREIQIMSSVRHPNIIHIYEVFENREKIVLVMEYAAGGELYDYLSQRKVLEETEARRIFRQISTAIYYCHKHKICHRDLKLENILLDEHGSAKIADFGLSNVFDGTRLLSTYCGSPLYASPEIVKGTPYQGPEVDCWSLGVLLYTLVYGAMPFDGSNFKRLVKQISQGDYFEPKKASTASPLIRDMLTVNSPDRATIEQICSHWWVNQGFNVSCLDIAEDLANQTPVRLDLLLSLAPPPENTEKIVVTDDQKVVPQEAPPRSMSVGSFMELDPNTEERVKSFVAREVPSDSISNEKTMKRKLEPVPSKSFSGARKKERMKPDTEQKEAPPSVVETEKSAKKEESNNLIMDIDSETNKVEEKVKDQDSSSKVESIPVEKTTSGEKVKQIEKVEKPEPATPEPSTAEPEKPNSESIAKDKPTRKSVKVVRKKVTEKKDSEKEKKEGVETADTKTQPKKKKTDSPVRENEEESKKEVTQENEISKEIKRDGTTRKSKGTVKATEREEKEKTPRSEESPTKPVERRKSKIFETAEKFMTNDQKSPVQEKPKKVYIPGVKVSDFAKAFERRSSVPATVPLKSSPTKKTIIKETSPVDKKQEVKPQTTKTKLPEKQKEENNSSHNDKAQTERVEKAKEDIAKSKETIASEEKTEGERQPTAINDEKLKKLKDSARNIISNALVEEERKKLKKQILKPPVPKTKTEDLENRKKSLTLQLGKETATVEVHTPENTRFLFEPDNEAATAVENKENIEKPKEKKTAKVEITLKSNTLPRRTSKAEVHLSSPQIKKDVGNFRTEVEHRVGDPSHVFSTQRSEVAFPVSAAQKPIRSMSLEPEGRMKQWPRKESTVERIIPIQVEGSVSKEEYEARDRIKDLERPHEGKQKHPYQRTWSLRSNSLSRQSTQDSDAESTISTKGEPIKKSPREFIIPIAVEGGGYVTPRATSLEPSENMSSKRSHRPFSKKFSLWSDNGSEDESPFPTLQRHSSRDFDEPFRLHRLRSSRPTKSAVDRADSASGSEEEEEDDDGFELLTAENLFSTLLSRVRSLTQRLNVEDGIRPGFPSSRLLSNHFGPSERLLSNFHQPLTRLSERSNFGRSVSRDLENGSNQWSRNDVTNSESNRSVPKGNSKLNRSDSDTESISDYSSSLSSHQKNIKNSEAKNREEVKKSKKQHYHSRTKSNPLPENDHVTEYVPTFEGNRSLYTPSRMWTSKVYEKESSPTKHRSGIPKLQRPSSLMLERRRDFQDKEDSFETEIDPEKPKEKDFYDILAEKYGITNVKRYDLAPEKRDRREYLMEKRSLSSSEKKEESEKKPEEKINDTKEGDVKEESLHDKYKGPSEKLAAVLNRLEGRGDKTVSVKKESTPVEKKINLGSPAMQDLYEKTVGEYKKSKMNDEDTGKSKIPKKISGRHKSDMTLKELENSNEKEGKHQEKFTKELKASEKSVLSKYLRYSSQDDEGKMMRKKSEPDVEVNEQFRNNVSKEKEESSPPPAKSKFLTSLEKKLEKLRASTEKKYVDKAIRSLRESSIGPKDVSSENVLIKRAVSVSDCPAYKTSQPGTKIQSTVNSVLGMFKKFETESDRKEMPENKEKSKIPVVIRGEQTASKVELLDRPSKNFEQFMPSSNRRYFTGNGFTFPTSASPHFDDSPTFLSPDSESFDSGSYCSDLGASEDIMSKNYHLYNNLDDLSRESVSERIRRKSFFTRFNEKKKPRRSSLLSRSYDTDSEWGEGKEKASRSFSINSGETCARPSYYRSVSSGDEPSRRTSEEVRPKPFYKSHISEGSNYRKNSFELSRNPTYKRSESQSPSPYTSLTLPRNFTREPRNSRSRSIYGSRSPELERPYSPFRPCSPRPASPFYYENPNNLE